MDESKKREMKKRLMALTPKGEVVSNRYDYDRPLLKMIRQLCIELRRIGKMHNPILLSRDTAAKYLSLNPLIFSELVKNDLLPKPVIVGKTTKRWRIKDLDDYISLLEASKK